MELTAKLLDLPIAERGLGDVADAPIVPSKKKGHHHPYQHLHNHNCDEVDIPTYATDKMWGMAFNSWKLNMYPTEKDEEWEQGPRPG